MSRPASSSAALPIAYVALRILIVVNWLFGAAILALLVVMPTEQWIMSALDLSPSPEADRLITGLARDRGRSASAPSRSITPSSNGCSRSLRSVRAGDPFVAANAARLQAIAWALLVLQAAQLRSSAQSPRPFRRRRIRSISMPAFRSTAGSPYSSRSCWPACSRKAR